MRLATDNPFFHSLVHQVMYVVPAFSPLLRQRGGCPCLFEGYYSGAFTPQKAWHPTQQRGSPGPALGGGITRADVHASVW